LESAGEALVDWRKTSGTKTPYFTHIIQLDNIVKKETDFQFYCDLKLLNGLDIPCD
jgi:hypothetical protein